jgi:long-subunit fatty acid transport protein
MKMRNYYVSICLFFPFLNLLAGGIVTNTNQSASWVRNPSTAAVTSIEAVYYNPAGLAKLENGLHISLSNQTIFQNREIENFYKGPDGTTGLNQSLYKGTLSAPIFPTFYAAYKINKLAFSFGFNPIGGGGTAEFSKGLPSFEIGVSDLVPALASQGATDYNLETYFKGSSIYLGYQVGATYQVNDMISVYGGARYVTVKNTNEGYLRNIQLNMGGNWLRGDTVMARTARQVSSMLGIPASLQPIIDGGAGGYNLSQAESGGIIDATTRTSLEQALGAIGVPGSNIPVMTIAQIQGTFQAATPTLNTQYMTARITSKLLRDQYVDNEQTGSGFCPILGVNISTEKLNIGFKYEFATKINIKNNTTLDFTVDSIPGTATTQFPDGEEIPSDIPGMFSFGASYKATDKLNVSGSFYYYFDKVVKYGKTDSTGTYITNKSLMNSNFYEYAIGAEYALSDKLLVSAGYLYSKSGVKDEFQADMSYNISSYLFSIGGKYSISPKIDLNLGVAYAQYIKSEKADFFSENFPTVSAKETYYDDVLLIGVGVNFKLTK